MLAPERLIASAPLPLNEIVAAPVLESERLPDLTRFPVMLRLAVFNVRLLAARLRFAMGVVPPIATEAVAVTLWVPLPDRLRSKAPSTPPLKATGKAPFAVWLKVVFAPRVIAPVKVMEPVVVLLLVIAPLLERVDVPLTKKVFPLS